MVKDPDTGRRISRVNPASEWEEQAAEHLRIVPRGLFAAVNGRPVLQVPQVRKNARILSGLLRCGACGAGMSIKGTMGRVTRIMCTRAKEARSCTNTRPYVLDDIEHTVIDGLRSRLKDQKLIDHYVACYNDEHKQLYSGQGVAREKARQRLAEAEREYDRVLKMAIKGQIGDAEIDAQLPPLRAEKKRLEQELAIIPEPPQVVTLKPALVKRYVRSLEQLEAAVRGPDAVSLELKAAIRELVTTVTVYPPQPGEKPEVRVDGYLSNMVDEGLS